MSVTWGSRDRSERFTMIMDFIYAMYKIRIGPGMMDMVMCWRLSGKYAAPPEEHEIE